MDGVDPSRRGSISMRGSRCFEDQEVGVAALHNSPGVCSWPCLRANRSSRSTAIIEADVADCGIARMKTFLVKRVFEGETALQDARGRIFPFPFDNNFILSFFFPFRTNRLFDFSE